MIEGIVDDPDSFARRFAFEIGEPRSRCAQPLNRRTMLEYWIELFVRFLKGNVSSTADLRDRTCQFLGSFLVRNWDEEELYRMVSKMETSGKSALGAGESSDENEGYDDEYDDEYAQPSPRAVGEAMHDSACAVFIVLSAITASLNIFMEPETILRDDALRDALAVARMSMAERGCTFELVQLLPEPDITARKIERYVAVQDTPTARRTRTKTRCRRERMVAGGFARWTARGIALSYASTTTRRAPRRYPFYQRPFLRCVQGRF